MINNFKNIFLVSNLLFAQYWTPFHIEELERNSDINLDYEYIDQFAQSQFLESFNRNELTHEVIGYLPYWEYDHYTSLDYNLISQINYFSVELDSYGNIVNDHNWNDLYLVDYAHARNVKVKLCATLFGQSELVLLLNNSDNRENAINNLLELVLNKNADGIDIDFELMPSSQRDNLVLFMSELSEAFHNQLEDPIITMATPAIDWNNAWDYYSLAEIVDGLFVMGYNYFYSGSSTAGPVSPLGGYFYDIEYTINDYIQKTEGQIDKIILGLPYYGYDWVVQSDTINSETIGSGVAKFYESVVPLSEDFGYVFDNQSNASWISYQGDSEWNQCWYDDSLSLSHKYQFAIDKDLLGVGIWALGYDNGYDQLWGALYDNFIDTALGDLNNDGILNILDLTILISIALGINDYTSSADFNNDMIVNILDIVELVNMILDIN